jgi:hypothetical protein
MSFMSEFKEFAVKGNAMDLAVGVIIGAAFGKIVDSIVKDLIMPIVGAIFGGFDFSNLFIALDTVPEGVAMTAQFHHPGVHCFHARQADQSPEKGSAACCPRANAGRYRAAA